MAAGEWLKKKKIVIPAAIVLVYIIAGFLLGPLVLKPFLIKKLGRQLERPVSIEKLLFNPFAASLRARGIMIKGKSVDTFVYAKEVFVDIAVLNLLTFTPAVSKILIADPFVHVIKNSDGTFNFSDLASAKPENEPNQTPEKVKEDKLFSMVVKNLQITRGKFHFDDQSADTEHRLENLEFLIPQLSTKPSHKDRITLIHTAFRLNEADVVLDAETILFAADRLAKIQLKTSDINVVHYLGYLPVPEGLQINGLDVNLDLKGIFKQPKDRKDSFEMKGGIAFSDADVRNSNNDVLVQFLELSVKIDPSDVLAGRVNIAGILLDTPKVNLNRDKSGQLEVMSFVSQKTGVKPEDSIENVPEPKKRTFQLNLADLQVKDGMLTFHDLSNAAEFKTIISPLSIKLENGIFGQTQSFDCKIELETQQKEKVAFGGHIQMGPFKADGTVKLSTIKTEQYKPYYDAVLPFDLRQGTADADIAFSIDQSSGSLSGGLDIPSFSLTSFKGWDKVLNEMMMDIPEFLISNARVDIGKKEISSGAVVFNNGNVLVKRHKDGRINLSGPEVAANDRKINKKEPEPQEKTNGKKSWKVILDSLDTSGYKIKYTDLTPGEPVNVALGNIRIKARDINNFDGKKAGQIEIGMNWNKQGQINVKGDMVPAHPSAALDVFFKKLDIKSLQPYFTDRVKILVTNGNLNASGKLKLNLDSSVDKKMQFIGSASITDFIALDKKSAKDFFKCGSLSVSGIDTSLSPVKVQIKEISLTDFYSRVIVEDSGDLNLANIFKSEEVSQPEPAEEKNLQKDKTSTPADIKFESVTLQNGRINFSDYQSQPNFTANMDKITGSLKGLSSKEDTSAVLNLKGIHGQSAPLDITGRINPLIRQPYADIDISFKDIELTKFTPYASKYLGYKIEKGKLVLDLEYQINGRELKSENRFRFDNFTLGEKTDSKEAVSLPVGLAISLLKDQNDQINLDLPVTGRLDDPEFRIGAIIFKMLANLVVKVVASPFSIIGSMFGGAEDLGYLEFEYGSYHLDESDIEKLDILVGILEKKPDVKLDIQGGFHRAKDAESLRIQQFDDVLKAEKLIEMTAKKADVKHLEDIHIKPEEKAFFVGKVYEKAEFPKPMNKSGKEKEVDTQEKIKLLMTHIDISEDELRMLAMERSQAVKSYLLSTGRVQKERVYMLEPKEKENADSSSGTRTEFLLK